MPRRSWWPPSSRPAPARLRGVAALVWFLLRRRSRGSEKYAGLRILRSLMKRAVAARPPKLVLCVIDAMAPEMLERAIAAGTAPVLERLVRAAATCPTASPRSRP